jgi:subtilisin family serine protease
MKEKYIILRSTRPFSGESFMGPSSFLGPTFRGEEVAATDLSVEIDELSHSDLGMLSNEDNVIALAPAVPMRLIEPVRTTDESQPTSVERPPSLLSGQADVAWGVKAVDAHTSDFSGHGMIAAVLDTGIDTTHPAFKGVNFLRKNFTTDSDDDQHGHGTHCAGTIFGRKTDNMRIGVAPGVRTALIGKVLGKKGASSDTTATAIQWAIDNGANVISMSLGIDFPGLQKKLQQAGFPPELATSRALDGYRANVQLFERLAAFVRARGAFAQATLIVAAAGNESRRDIDPSFEIAVSPPAVSEGIISVAALAQGDPAGLTVAFFSNTGANVSAPGVDVVSAKLGGGLCSLSGTSMATPHVAGVALLWAEKIKQSKPLSAFEWTGRLAGSATTEGLKPGFVPLAVGAGLVRAPQS